jgi:predicted transcriptional regulator
MGEKKIFSTRIDSDRIKELKHLSVDTDKSLGRLLEEAIKDICRKYEKQSNNICPRGEP